MYFEAQDKYSHPGFPWQKKAFLINLSMHLFEGKKDNVLCQRFFYQDVLKKKDLNASIVQRHTLQLICSDMRYPE
jgi:hypothetical protein